MGMPSGALRVKKPDLGFCSLTRIRGWGTSGNGTLELHSAAQFSRDRRESFAMKRRRCRRSGSVPRPGEIPEP
jgi:hypothetical protein